MSSSLLDFVDIPAERILKIKCKDCDWFLEYESANNNVINGKRLSCMKNYWEKIEEEFKNRFKKTFKFSNNEINGFILLLRKDAYEFMDDWEKTNKTLLPEKEDFYSNLNMEDITDSDYNHSK